MMPGHQVGGWIYAGEAEPEPGGKPRVEVVCAHCGTSRRPMRTADFEDAVTSGCRACSRMPGRRRSVR